MLKEPLNCLTQSLYYCTFSSAMYRFRIASHPLQYFFFLFHFVLFLNKSHPYECEVVSRVVLICISLMTNDVQHLLTRLLVVHKSLGKCLLKSFAHFWLWLFFWLLLSCQSSLYTLDINHLSYIWFVSIFSILTGDLLTLLVSFLLVFEKWLCHMIYNLWVPNLKG